MPREKINVSICVMREYFLYLPVFYAQHTRCFGKLPPRYELSIELAPTVARRTDEGVIETLLSDRQDDAHYWFGVCDPAPLLQYDGQGRSQDMRILATIVSSSAFWAVNHRAFDAQIFSDLAKFQQIIAYRAGTTSNLIAQQIVQHKPRGKRRNAIMEVEPGQEFVSFPKTSEGTLMISPEIDEIERLVARERRFGIEYDIGNTTDFANVLTTALLSRDEIVQEHKALVVSLMEGIQIALTAIHKNDASLVEFCRKSTRGRDVSERALRRALSSRVIPTSIEVGRDAWEKSATLYYRAIDESRPTEADLRTAAVIYEKCILKVADLNQLARRNADQQITTPVTPGWVLVMHQLLGAIAGVGLTLIFLADEFKAAGSALLTVLIGFVLQVVLHIRWLSIASIGHWVPMLWMAGFTAATVAGKLNWLEFSLAVSTVMIGWIAVLFYLRPKSNPES